MPVFGQVDESGRPLGASFTSVPWHRQQPFTAAADNPCGSGDGSAVERHTIGELIPFGFGPANLESPG